MDSTDESLAGVSRLELDAARGELPDWARATPKRREHMARVAGLMEEWGGRLGLPEEEKLRWAAAGWLHDALRDEDPAVLRWQVRAAERDLPGRVLHGPAAAGRLEGEVDPRVLAAVRYHTIGHPALERLGRALYLADFLEPGRDFAVEWRAALRVRMPGEQDSVLVEVLAARICHLLEQRKPIRPETAAFWSTLMPMERR
ncbi:MAG TPA: HD domain-containing protein [Longimicrobiaceae bacterium]|nr:HD domain-containing protein [Longimicrobiaceae bacterium]